ncbi:MAG: exo-alpha-sialidase [Phycisphaerae bacterium]|nr:exo-alpha-sialidase [Phycisphaerae bacterium]
MSPLSRDHGRTWGKPARLAGKKVSWGDQNIVVPFTEGFGRPVTARNGDVLVPIGCRSGGGFYGDKAPTFVRSGDDGKTWGSLEFIAAEPKKFSETSMGVAGNGCIIAVIRCDTTRRMLWQCSSRDNGRTWSKPVRTRRPNGECIKGKMPDILALPSGRLLLAVGSVDVMDGSEIWKGPHGAGYSGLFVSDDHGATWRKDVMFRSPDPENLVPYDAPVLVRARSGDVLALSVQADRRAKDDPRSGWTMGSHYVMNVLRETR